MTVNRYGKRYYRYRDPSTGKYVGMGGNLREACRAAQILNERRQWEPKAAELVARVTNQSTGFEAFSKVYIERISELAEASRKEYKRYIAKAVEQWGNTPLDQITRKDVTEWLEPMTPNTRNMARRTLIQVMKHAVADGLIDSNPAEGTLTAKISKQRRRLTLDEFEEIQSVSQPWLRRALYIGLRTCLRIEDLVGLKADDWNPDVLSVIPQKTAQHGVRLRFNVDPRLKAVIEEYRPQSGYLIERNGRGVSSTGLRRAFNESRDQVITDDHPPTFHEIRALGAKLIETAGKDPQLVLGHKDPKTTRIYLDRHEQQWTEVHL